MVFILFWSCVQTVLQFVQDGEHGQCHLHLVPAAVVGRRQLQPGGLLPGRPAPIAGDWPWPVSHNGVGSKPHTVTLEIIFKQLF